MDNNLFNQLKAAFSEMDATQQNGDTIKQRLTSLSLCQVLLQWESEQAPLTSGLSSNRLNAYWQPIGESVRTRLTQLIAQYEATNQAFTNKVTQLKLDIIEGEEKVNNTISEIEKIRGEMESLANELDVNQDSVSEMVMTLESLEQKHQMLLKIQQMNKSLAELSVMVQSFEDDMRNGQLPETLLKTLFSVLNEYNAIIEAYKLHTQENEQISKQLASLVDIQNALDHLNKIKLQLTEVDELLRPALEAVQQSK